MPQVRIKKRKRKKGWFYRLVRKKSFWISISASFIIIVVGAYIGMNMAVNYALKSITSDMIEVAEVPSGSEQVDGSEVNEANTDPASTKGGDTGTDNPKNQNQAGNATNTDSGSENTSSNTDSKPASTSVITIEKAKEVEKDVKLTEKAKVMAILAKRLSASDMKKLTGMAGGGVTKQEKKEAKAIILGKLPADEYDEIIQIAKKHGLSSGKTYEESTKK